MRSIKIVSTDSEVDQQVAECAPYISAGAVVAVSQPGVRGEDGGTEHAEPVIEDYSQILPGAELQENAAGYNRRLEDFKTENPDFDAFLGSTNVQIVTAVRDEILRSPNGPRIAHFLAAYPAVAEELLSMHPLEAARIVREEMAPDLARGILPSDDGDYESWKRARNPKVRRREK